MKKIVYVDMDGVIADFDRAIRQYYPTIDSVPDGEFRGDIIDEICEANTSIFSTLHPIDGGIEAMKLLSEYYEIYFLSTPMWNVPDSFTGKRLWIRDHFGEWANKRLILTHRKDLNIGDYLVDDRLKNGAAEFKGKHIHFGNSNFPSWKEVIEFLIMELNEVAIAS